MENKFTLEQMEKAKNCKTAEELLALAKENGISLTEAEAINYFAQFNPKNGELSDEELDAVDGGGCYSSNGHLIVTQRNKCDLFAPDPKYPDSSACCMNCRHYWVYKDGNVEKLLCKIRTEDNDPCA